MATILLPELSEWVLSDPITEEEDHAVTFVDLPKGLSVEYLPGGLCLALRVFEEVRKLLSERPGRRSGFRVTET
jgi:hypothetical protein